MRITIILLSFALTAISANMKQDYNGTYRILGFKKNGEISSFSENCHYSLTFRKRNVTGYSMTISNISLLKLNNDNINDLYIKYETIGKIRKNVLRIRNVEINQLYSILYCIGNKEKAEFCSFLKFPSDMILFQDTLILNNNNEQLVLVRESW